MDFFSGKKDLLLTLEASPGFVVASLVNLAEEWLRGVSLALFPASPACEFFTLRGQSDIPPRESLRIPVAYISPSDTLCSAVVVFAADGGDFLIVDGSCLLPACDASVFAGSAWGFLIPRLVKSTIPLDEFNSIAPIEIVSAFARHVPGIFNQVEIGNPSGYAWGCLNPVMAIWHNLSAGVIEVYLPTGDDGIRLAKKFDNWAWKPGEGRRAIWDLGGIATLLRLYLDIGWNVEDTQNELIKTHRLLLSLRVPPVLAPIETLLAGRQSLGELSPREVAIFNKSIIKLERLVAPA